VDVDLAVAAPVGSIKNFLEFHEVALLLVELGPHIPAAVVVRVLLDGLSK
jgi:hypothetical protein